MFHHVKLKPYHEVNEDCVRQLKVNLYLILAFKDGVDYSVEESKEQVRFNNDTMGSS